MWRPVLIAAALCALATAAQAGEASDVADRGGFLLGHAYRCGIKAEQLQPAAQLIHDLAAALAADEDDKTGADKTFAERFVVSAVSDSLGQPLPSCAVIKRELAELDHHNPDAVASGPSAAPAQATLSAGAPARTPTRHAKAAHALRPGKPASHKFASEQRGRRAPAT